MRPDSQLEEAVCFAALNVPDPDLRARFLDQACAGDARFRAVIEEMLRAHAGSEELFESGRAGLSLPDLDARTARAIKESNSEIEFTDERIGSHVGRYKLVQKIGEGGCGTVYLAEQAEPVRRQVALKVIKLGMDTRSVIARFEAERQALAMMDHPNIARVLDAGATETGRPFFVMELVRGTRITRYCDDQKLNTAARLALFIQVCRAIQHAHQKGVIHRDIKPSNILVSLHDGSPLPKVIDFGIAKATDGRLTDRTVITSVEQFTGTPDYMSPEQAATSGLDIDTRSDIYSLGVLLYELLTGKTPFENRKQSGSGLEEMRRTLREEEPKLPSAMIASLERDELAPVAAQRHAEPARLIAELKGDLDWIVMKALEKDRDRRYDTAYGLAMDLQRHLDHEPVLARPPGALYRLRKLVRRNRVVFAAGGAVALALVIGLGTSTRLFFLERAALEREARLREDAEDRARINQAVVYASQQKFESARQTLEQVGTDSSTPTLDHVAAYRSVGEWFALNNRWPEAAKHYAKLVRFVTLDRPSLVILDHQAYAVVLAEMGDFTAYRRFCQKLLADFTDKPNERILISCLLFPMDREQLAAVEPLGERMEKRLSWRTAEEIPSALRMPIALWSYRRGNHKRATDWCKAGLTHGSRVPAYDATLHLILAMTRFQSGETRAAHQELEMGRQMVDAKFAQPLDPGRTSAGYWYDWIAARILLREASELIRAESDTLDSE